MTDCYDETWDLGMTEKGSLTNTGLDSWWPIVTTFPNSFRSQEKA